VPADQIAAVKAMQDAAHAELEARVERRIGEAIRRAGLLLTRTSDGYEVRKLFFATAGALLEPVEVATPSPPSAQDGVTEDMIDRALTAMSVAVNYQWPRNAMRAALEAAMTPSVQVEADAARLDWLIAERFIAARAIKYRRGNFTELHGFIARPVVGICTEDVRAAVDAARAIQGGAGDGSKT